MLYSNDLNNQPNANLIEVLPNNARFHFRVGLNFEELEPLRARVDEACTRLVSVGFIPNLKKITRPIDFTSIYSTNAIEGGTADLELVEKIMEGNLRKPKNETERRVKNLVSAYHKVEKYYNSPRVTKLYPPTLLSNVNTENFVFQLSESLFQSLNEIIMTDLSMKTGKPGEYRDDQKQAPTMVGNADTGGVYKPPRKAEYIKQLMEAFIGWMNSEPINQLSVLYRAPLTHFYYELIHPFGDGNGRVGRLVELILLGNVGYEHVGKLMAEYYYKNIKKYFTLFNECRKNIEKKEIYPITQFVKFFLQGMLSNINYLQDKANEEIARLYYWKFLQTLLRDKKINYRQFSLMEILFFQKGSITNLSQLKEYPAYKGLYHNLTKKTQSRDLKTLQELDLLQIDSNKNIRIIYINPALILEPHPFCIP